MVVPNVGYWKVRWQLAFTGHSPMTPSFPDTWYGSATCRYFTIADWEDLCRKKKFRIVQSKFLTSGGSVGLWPNVRAEVAMYVLEDGL